MAEPDKLVDFEAPPVSEVAMGVQFAPLTGFLVPHFGLLWAEFSEVYPAVDEHPPLAPHREVLTSPGEVDVRFSERPTLPRVWLVADDGSELLQVQRERFHLNWQRRSVDADYPGFVELRTRFLDRWARFRGFCSEFELGDPALTQAELTYVNPIPLDQAGVGLHDLGGVLPDVAWRRAADRGGFLPEFESMRGLVSFLLPDGAGRLWAGFVTRHDDTGADELVLELTVRGLPAGDDLESWLDRAREWIVHGFADLTSQQVQQNVWRRTR